jgi:hypothetical protein
MIRDTRTIMHSLARTVFDSLYNTVTPAQANLATADLDSHVWRACADDPPPNTE